VTPDPVVAGIIGALVGATFGSSAGVALTRWGAGGSVGSPRRSVCASCGCPVRARDNIPIVSYIALRGRCRDCGAAIDRRLLVLEVSCAAMGALVMTVGLAPPVALVVGFTGWAMILATATDLERRIIPDRLTLPLAAIVLPLALVMDMTRLGAGLGGLQLVAQRIVVPALVLPVSLLAMNGAGRRLGGGAILGGGDIKLLVGVGAAVAMLPQGVLILWMGALLVGGAAAGLGLLTGRLRMKDRIPFAPFLLAGFVAAVIGAHPQVTLIAEWW
jgi:leader peptidase (prepilin peptidase)/N-methyltransferase